MTHFALCCNPAPGDLITGYVTVGRGVAIHRRDCPNVLQLPQWKRLRLIDVAWGAEAEVYPVEIEIQALDRKGLLKDVYHVLAQEHINVMRSETQTNPTDRSVEMHLTLEVADLGQLSVALDKLNEINNVLAAQRREHGDSAAMH
jgi:GTP pyrophosphokinase